MEFITLQQYDIRWNDLFSIEQRIISSLLGQEIDKVHHIGSTAVPGLLAKPIIDIAVESVWFPPSQAMINRLDAIGYDCRGEAGVRGRFWFTKGHPRKFNLHCCLAGSGIIKNQIAFRNKLINNADFRREYEIIKLKNYKDRDIDSPDYADAKSGFIQKVIAS